MGVVTGGGGGGGAATVTESAYYSGSPVSVADGASTTLPWTILDSGTAMFDLTTPTHPVVLKAGLFIVCAQVAADSLLSPGGSITADLIIDYGNDNVEIFNQGFAGPAGASVVVVASYVLAAGAQIRLFADNNDGVSTRGLIIKNATVARIGSA